MSPVPSTAFRSALFAIALAAAPVFSASAALQESSDEKVRDLTAAPTIRKAPEAPKCTCPDSYEAGAIMLKGIVVDAEMTAAADGRSANDWMATIFDVVYASDGSAKGRTRVWHSNAPGKCGLTFDYGRKYALAVREGANGYETDKCLMRQAQ